MINHYFSILPSPTMAAAFQNNYSCEVTSIPPALTDHFQFVPKDFLSIKPRSSIEIPNETSLSKHAVQSESEILTTTNEVCTNLTV